MSSTAIRAFLASLLGAVLAACASTSTPIDQQSTADGLERVEIRGFDAVYRRKDVDLSKYNKLMLRPVEVAFRENWKPERDSYLYRMNPPDRERIRTSVAENFVDVFRKELETNGGYEIVSEAGGEVLEVRPSIIDLYITAPDVSMDSAARVTSYVVDTGEMTLVGELHDSVTQQILARAYDRYRGGNRTWFHASTSVWNTAEARRVMQGWAHALRQSLDAARGKQP